MNLTSFSAVALLVTALYTFQNLLRYAKAQDMNGVAGILVAALSGWGVVALAAHASVTSALVLVDGGTPLGRLDAGSLLLLGVAVGSAGTTLADVRKALDASTSAEKPRLVGAPPVPPAAG